MEEISSMTPQPSENSNWASYMSLNVVVSKTPHPQGNSNPFCGGEYGYFPELHNAHYTTSSTEKNSKKSQAI